MWQCPCILTDWLAWKRRGPANRVLFVLSLSLAAFVTLTFAGASLYPDPGNFARYFAFYWVWGLCALGVLLGMAEYKPVPCARAKNVAISSYSCTWACCLSLPALSTWSSTPVSGLYRALLFDLDGTLAETDSLHLPTWVDALEPYGVE